MHPPWEPFLVALDLRGRDCLVVGGTTEAEEKARGLLACGARVTVVAPTVTEGLRALHREGSVAWEARALAPSDTEGSLAVVLSTERDEALSARLQAEARARGFLLCCLDQPGFSNFANVAVVRRGLLSVGFSTGGAAPAVVKRLREGLSSALDARFQRWLEAVAALRQATAPERRRAVLSEALRGFRLEVKLRLPPGA
ncbi:MAG: bifunctional precorrin-2 dehydrogenase/sirohydrochlorin ferrochelatase [Deltaproteobacteria bacterium]|nr:bifunctional precorrin-2 dehydrogenase/sirohydrochlorin ferrochelatase [Deltaproteobacteria bacterium]